MAAHIYLVNIIQRGKGNYSFTICGTSAEAVKKEVKSRLGLGERIESVKRLK